MVSLIVCVGCDSPKSKTSSEKPLESLTVGIQRRDISALILIAENRGYFAEQGVNVEFKEHESGVASIKDLLGGHVDLAPAAEFVIAANILQGADLRIIASIDKGGDEVKLVARKDHGITQVSDIRNKRVGLLSGSIAPYFFDLFMTMQDIPSQDIQMVDLPPSEQVIAIGKGEIDALVVWEDFATKAKTALGKNAIAWSAQGEHSYHWVLAGTDETVKKRSSAIRKFLAALVSAENFIREQRHEAEEIVAAQLGSKHTSWEHHIFELELERSLILAMENQIKWIYAKRTGKRSNMPDLLDYIHLDALKSVAPDKIRIDY